MTLLVHMLEASQHLGTSLGLGHVPQLGPSLFERFVSALLANQGREQTALFELTELVPFPY